MGQSSVLGLSFPCSHSAGLRQVHTTFLSLLSSPLFIPAETTTLPISCLAGFNNLLISLPVFWVSTFQSILPAVTGPSILKCSLHHVSFLWKRTATLLGSATRLGGTEGSVKRDIVGLPWCGFHGVALAGGLLCQMHKYRRPFGSLPCQQQWPAVAITVQLSHICLLTWQGRSGKGFSGSPPQG